MSKEYFVLSDSLILAGKPHPRGSVVSLSDSDAANLLTFGAIAVPKSVEAALVDLNSASKGELMDVKNIGSSTADKLISGRPYESLEEAFDASEMDESKWNEIADQLTI